MSKSLRGSLLLLLASAVWGAAFVAQRVGMDSIGPLWFNGLRMLLAGVVLLPVIRIADRKKGTGAGVPKDRKTLWKAGGLCGLFLFIASNLQQVGLVQTTAGKAGFITALYVVLVPVSAWMIFRKSPGWVIWIGVALAVVGMYLLCVPSGEQELNQGDLLVLGCAICFTGHILTVDRFSPRVDGIRLSCIQFFVCGGLSVAVALFREQLTAEMLKGALIPMLYAGILSGGVGYTLQIVAQKDTNPTVASLVMCMESVFALLSGALILGEKMTSRETWGCVVMFAAVILSQLSPLLKKTQATDTPLPGTKDVFQK